MKPSWLHKQNSSLLALQSYSTETITLFHFIPVHWNHCGFPIISSPNWDCDLLKEKTMSPISVPGPRMGTHWVLKDSVRQKWKYYSFYCAFSPKFHNWTTEIRQNFTKHFCLTLYCTPMPYQQQSATLWLHPTAAGINTWNWAASCNSFGNWSHEDISIGSTINRWLTSVYLFSRACHTEGLLIPYPNMNWTETKLQFLKTC